ncbi:hypothetical protein ACTFIR_005543 [Dictyostelium discoideum]
MSNNLDSTYEQQQEDNVLDNNGYWQWIKPIITNQCECIILRGFDDNINVERISSGLKAQLDIIHQIQTKHYDITSKFSVKTVIETIAPICETYAVGFIGGWYKKFGTMGSQQILNYFRDNSAEVNQSNNNNNKSNNTNGSEKEIIAKIQNYNDLTNRTLREWLNKLELITERNRVTVMFNKLPPMYGEIIRKDLQARSDEPIASMDWKTIKEVVLTKFPYEVNIEQEMKQLVKIKFNGGDPNKHYMDWSDKAIIINDLKKKYGITDNGGLERYYFLQSLPDAMMSDYEINKVTTINDVVIRFCKIVNDNPTAYKRFEVKSSEIHNGNNSNNSSKIHHSIKCYQCGKMGHRKEDCRIRKFDSVNNNNNGNGNNNYSNNNSNNR